MGREYNSVLFQNYPNPFNSSTIIRFALRENVGISLKIYEANGREVRVLKEGVHPPGVYRVIWDGRDKEGRLVPSGVYFYRLEAGGEVQTKQIVILR